MVKFVNFPSKSAVLLILQSRIDETVNTKTANNEGHLYLATSLYELINIMAEMDHNTFEENLSLQATINKLFNLYRETVELK